MANSFSVKQQNQHNLFTTSFANSATLGVLIRNLKKKDHSETKMSSRYSLRNSSRPPPHVHTYTNTAPSFAAPNHCIHRGSPALKTRRKHTEHTRPFNLVLIKSLTLTTPPSLKAILLPQNHMKYNINVVG